MTIIKDIAFVGYPVKSVTEARKFYEGLLGLVPDPAFNGDTWVEYPVGSGTFTIGSMDGWIASKDGPSAAFEVEDLSSLVQKLKENNIKVNLDIQDFPNCKMAMVADVDGNSLVLHQKKMIA